MQTLQVFLRDTPYLYDTTPYKTMLWNYDNGFHAAILEDALSKQTKDQNHRSNLLTQVHTQNGH